MSSSLDRTESIGKKTPKKAAVCKSEQQAIEESEETKEEPDEGKPAVRKESLATKKA